MGLNNQLKEIALSSGVNYFGIADLSSVQDILREQGGEDVAGYPYAISLGITLMHSIVDRLPDRHEYSVAVNYEHNAYKNVNQRLDQTALLLGSALQNKGYRALPIPASATIDDERLCGAFSHKLAANLSGLGWIGKSCLLVTPDNGPRVRWVSILTDAPLTPTNNKLEVKCGDCMECVEACPVQAFSGRIYEEGEPRDMRYDARKCDLYFDSLKEQGKPAVCGMCLYACPHGRKHKR